MKYCRVGASELSTAKRDAGGAGGGGRGADYAREGQQEVTGDTSNSESYSH